MDERRNTIRELERDKKSDADSRNRLLEGLGEILLQRIGNDDPFPDRAGNTPGGILSEYRRMQKDIADSGETIKSLEADILVLKDLEQKIGARAEEHSVLAKELGEEYIHLGTSLLERSGDDDSTDPVRQRHEIILAKISEQEKKLDELEDREGGILAWLSKSAQMTVARALIIKNRSALQKLYREAGETFLARGSAEGLDGEAAEHAGKALEKAGLVSSLARELEGLRTERKTIMNRFGAEGSPSRRIQGLQRHIDSVRAEIPGVYLRLGSLAEENNANEVLSPFIVKEDGVVFEKAKALKLRIAETELKIQKLQAAISIDDEKAEIEKIQKAVAGQKQKISAAELAIADLEKQLAESEQHIAELEGFIKNN